MWSFGRIPQGTRWIYVGNNSRVEVKGEGTCKLELRGGRTLLLHDVLYAPDIRRNLVSVRVLLELGYTLNFSGRTLTIYFDSEFYGSGYISSGFIILDIDYSQIQNNNNYSLIASSSNALIDATVWHSRLGHIGQDRMNHLAKEGLLEPLSHIDLPVCEQCLAEKATWKPFGEATRAQNPLQLIHSNICGPMKFRARHDAHYFITFINDFTHFGIVYLISHRYEALDCFKHFQQMAENQLTTKIKALQTNRGREYLSDQFCEWCEEKGIARQLTIPCTPQQNGVAEQRNKTLLDMVRSMMAQANLPISFWGDALLTAAYILNRVPSKSVSSTPYELWTERKPNLAHLRP